MKDGSVPACRTLRSGIPAITRLTDSRNPRNLALFILLDVVDVSAVQFSKLIRVPALAQKTVRVRYSATGLSFLDPRLSTVAPHGMRMRNSVA